MKKYAVLLLLAGIIAVSGCTDTGQGDISVTTGNGMSIVDYTVDPMTVDENDLVTFSVTAQNVGDVTAENINIMLNGIDGNWRNSGFNLVDETPSSEKTKLEPPVPSKNRIGELYTAFWSFYPPDLPEGVTTPMPVTAMITYDYKATSSIIIKGYHENLYKTMQYRGESVVDPYSISNSASPIQIGLKPGIQVSAPLIVEDDNEEYQKATYVIEFKNVGDGWPISGDETGTFYTTDDFGTTLTVSGPGVSFEECLSASPGDTTVEIGADDINLIKLKSSGTSTFGCTIRIDKNSWTPQTSGSIVFNFDMRYRYYTQKEATVNVIGQK